MLGLHDVPFCWKSINHQRCLFLWLSLGFLFGHLKVSMSWVPCPTLSRQWVSRSRLSPLQNPGMGIATDAVVEESDEVGGRPLNGRVKDLSIVSNHNEFDESVIAAASTVTRMSCKLLGTKSIGVDFGLARTGVAVTIGYEPKALDIISDSNATKVARRIVNYCLSEQASRIVIGLPLHKNGTEAEQTTITREFASQLACLSMARLGPSVLLYLWDERYTSKEAAARVRSVDPDTMLRGTLDADAACIILENYYSENGEGAEKVHVPLEFRESCEAAWQTQQRREGDRLQGIQEQREANMKRRQAARERAAALEAQMAKDGVLGSNKKRKKKRKKRR